MRYWKITFVVAALYQILAMGQESISFRFEIPQDVDGEITAGNYRQIEQKIKSSYKGKNVFSTQTPFSVVPNIQLIDVKTSGEAHMVKVVKVNLALTIQDLDNEIQFNRFSATFLGTADDVPQAITKALNQLKASDPKLKSFFTEGEKNIRAFYQTNCNKIIKSAVLNIERKQYNKAFALLKYVPEELGCYPEVEKLMTRIYTSTKEINCSEMLHKAKMAHARQDFSEALEFLNVIDPNAKCYPEASKLLAEVGASINKEVKDKQAMARLEFEKKSDLEKVKILAHKADYLQIPETIGE